MPKRRLPADFTSRELQRVQTEAEGSSSALRFLFESAGIHVPAEPPYTEEGLCEVERLYRDNHSQFSDPGSVEYQMGLFLGQVMVRSTLGEWAYYEGTYHVMDPLVIRLSSEQLFVQPLLFCHGLRQKKAMGSLSGQSLLQFLRRAHCDAQP